MKRRSAQLITVLPIMGSALTFASGGSPLYDTNDTLVLRDPMRSASPSTSGASSPERESPVYEPKARRPNRADNAPVRS